MNYHVIVLSLVVQVLCFICSISAPLNSSGTRTVCVKIWCKNSKGSMGSSKLNTTGTTNACMSLNSFLVRCFFLCIDYCTISCLFFRVRLLRVLNKDIADVSSSAVIRRKRRLSTAVTGEVNFVLVVVTWTL